MFRSRPIPVGRSAKPQDVPNQSKAPLREPYCASNQVASRRSRSRRRGPRTAAFTRHTGARTGETVEELCVKFFGRADDSDKVECLVILVHVVRDVMTAQTHRIPIRIGFRFVVALLAACFTASGCLGPAAVRSTRMQLQRGGPRHERRAALDEPGAAPVRRLAHLHRPAQHHEPVRGGGRRERPRTRRGQTTFGIAGLSGRDTPTLSYHPRQGREIAKALLNPLSADLYQRGQRRGEARPALVDDPQRHQRRAERGPGHDPGPARPRRQRAVPPRRPTARRDRRPRRRGDRVLDERGRPTTASDPIPAGHVQGRDLLGAAKDGYVYRDKGRRPDGPLQAGKGADPEDPLPLHSLPRDGGAGADLPPDPGPQPLQDRVGIAARRREQPAGRLPAGATRSTSTCGRSSRS